MKLNKNKLWMIVFFVGMFLMSLTTAWIMGNNFNKDINKERYKLTLRYKDLKKLDYNYDAASGSKLFLKNCANCHGKLGQGSMMTPPLIKSELVLASNHMKEKALLKVIVKGLKGSIVRNNQQYNSVMPAFKYMDETDLANIANYLRQAINVKHEQKLEIIHPVEFNKAKIDTLTFEGMFTEQDL